MLSALALLSISSVVALRIEATNDVSRELRESLQAELLQAVEARTKMRAVLDDATTPCADDCGNEVRSRLAADEVVVVRLFAAIRLLRLVAKRPVTNGPEYRFEVDFAAKAPLHPIAEKLASTLFPQVTNVEILPPPVEQPPPQPSSKVGAWMLAATSAAILGASIGFGISSAQTRTTATSPFISNAEYDRLADRTVTHAWIANGGFVLSLSCGALATAMLLDWIP